LILYNLSNVAAAVSNNKTYLIRRYLRQCVLWEPTSIGSVWIRKTENYSAQKRFSEAIAAAEYNSFFSSLMSHK